MATVYKSDANDVFAHLLRLKAAYTAFFRTLEDDTEYAEALSRMKAAAHALYDSIWDVCDRGDAVVLYSPRGGGRRHVVRTVGPLSLDGITFRYSSEVHSDRCLNYCVMV